MKKQDANKTNRRSFLKGAGVAAAAVGSGVVSAETLEKPEHSEPSVVRPSGYQETDHVREYYRVARF